jgi:hypothetical protein
MFGAAVRNRVPGGVGESDAPFAGAVSSEHGGEGTGVVGVEGTEPGDLAAGGIVRLTVPRIAGSPGPGVPVPPPIAAVPPVLFPPVLFPSVPSPGVLFPGVPSRDVLFPGVPSRDVPSSPPGALLAGGGARRASGVSPPRRWR